MKKIKHICFDLDGTLCSSHDTIYSATVKTLTTLDITDNLDKYEFCRRIGHQFSDIFDDLNIKVSNIEHFIKVFKSFYFDFIDQSQLYSGVNIILDYLNQNDFSVSLLTTKSQGQADMILKHFNIDKSFTFVLGRSSGSLIKPSPEPLLYICNKIGYAPDETIMVGDSELDVQCGKGAGAKTCAVTYGYRDVNILMAEDPDYLIDSITEIKDIV